MIRSFAAACTALAFVAIASPAPAEEGVELGLLDCVVDGGTGFIIGSTKDIKCTYSPAGNTFAPEAYFGVIRKFGIDIGITGTTVIQWLVVAPNADIYVPGALEGDYVGASAEATAGIGAGANLLVGGSSQSFTLQPVSIQTQTGLNLAIGVTSFQLRSSD